MLLALTAQDIAMFIINVEKECSLETEGGESQYVSFDLGTWMDWASATHFCMFCLIIVSMGIAAFCVDILDAEDSRWDITLKLCGGASYCVVSMAWLFLLAWTVIGFLFYSEIRNHGVNNQQCTQVLLGWLIMHVLSYCCLGICSSLGWWMEQVG